MTNAIASYIYYISRNLLFKIEDNTAADFTDILKGLPSKAWLLRDNIEIEIEVNDIKINDLIAVSSGEIIPVDGIVESGACIVDQHILTGESKSIEKYKGEEVFACTLVRAGKVIVRVTKSGDETVVADIKNIFNKTINFKSSLQSKGEKIADNSIIPMLGLSSLTFALKGSNSAIAMLGSYIGGDIRFFIPLSAVNYFKIASQKGILIKDIRVDIIIFDKTGTLTIDEFTVTGIYPSKKYNETQILTYAAIAEQRQNHPLAKAINLKAAEKNIKINNYSDIMCEFGLGIKIAYKKDRILVGSLKFMEMENIIIDRNFFDSIKYNDKGNSYIYIAKNNEVIGVIELQTSIRTEAESIINQLKNLNKEIYIISGDNEMLTQKTAEALQIQNYFSGVRPEKKGEIIEELQKKGKKICFIGDGINDSIALKKAQVSISLSGASNIAVDTASIILMDGSLTHLPEVFKIAKGYKHNTNSAFVIALVPGLINIGAVYAFNLTIYGSIILYYAGLGVGIGNAYIPVLKEKFSK